MEPITRSEIYMAAAAGEYSGELPEPVTRLEYYLKKIKEAVENGSSVAPEDIDAAIEAYLDSHDADIVTEQELSDALAGYYDKSTVDTALDGKADVADIPDVSSFIDADVDNLANYYDKSTVDTALAGKAAASHTHDDRYYTESEIDGKIQTINTAIAGKSAGDHTHDDRYYTETETDNKLGEKSNTGHLHDDRYYTETEIDNKLSGKADSSDIPDVSSFITKAVNDLTYYYTKSETYTQTEIDNMVSAIPKFAIEVVQSLPSSDISGTTVYLLTVQNNEQNNLYDEYIYVNNDWELLGTQSVDLSGYYTSAQVDALLSGLSLSGHTHDDRYYTETEIDAKVQEINSALSGKAAASHTHDDRYYTETEIDTKLGGKSNTGHSHDDRYYTETELDNMLGAKQDALTAGDNVSIATVNGVLTISATDTDTTYSAGTGLSLSGTTFSNSAPNVKSDWNAAVGTDAEILNKPTIPSYSNATASAAGLMSAADKIRLDGQGVVLWESSNTNGDAIAIGTGSSDGITLSASLSGYRFVEVYFGNTQKFSFGKAFVDSGGNTGQFQLILSQYISSQSLLGIGIVGCKIMTTNGVSKLYVIEGTSYTITGSTSSQSLTFNANTTWGGSFLKVVGYK